MCTGVRSRFALAVAALVFVACHGNGGPGSSEPTPLVTDPNATAVVAGQTAFAADLYRGVRSQDGNLLFSPYSIHEALSILRTGARARSAEQLDQVLQLPKEGAQEGWSVLHASVRGDRQATLRVGNRLWIDDRFSLDPQFRAAVQSAHGASIVGRSLDDADSVSREVNTWVNDVTEGMIPEVMSPAQVPPDAGLVLVNAIYFHGKWLNRFERGHTRPLAFTTSSGRREDVPMMSLSGMFRYQQDETVRTLALPYRGGTTEFVILLPTEADGLSRLEDSLTGSTVAAWSTQGSSQEVDLLLPRFRFESGFDLLPLFAALGLELTDPTRVDLNGVGTDPRGPLRLSTATHSALIELDEEGTKAAAATAVAASCYRSPEPTPIPFRCDRPFLFLIRHVPTGAVLFLGRVVSPPKA